MVGHWVIGKPDIATVYCREGEQPMVIRLGKRTAHLDILNSGHFQSFVPRLRKEDFVVSDVNENAAVWRAIPLPATILSGYDLKSKQHRYVVGSFGFADQEDGCKTMCARNIGSKSYPIWSIQNEQQGK
jgi:hypothetical protein